MKKTLCILFAICLSSHAMDFISLLTKKKIDPIQTSPFGYEHEFQINLKENQQKLSTGPSPYQHFDHIPALGFYGDPYQFSLRLALIELNPHMITYALPDSLKKSLIQHIAPGKSLQEVLHGRTVYAHVMISGFIPGKNTYNIVFHPFGYSFMKPPIEKPYFNIYIPMGIFNPHGIAPTSHGISFEQFNPENVNAHNGASIAFSPNNARIALSPNRSISTFWSAAYSPDKNYITITYHIMVNDQKIEENFKQFIKTAANLENLLSSLEIAKNTLANPEDKNALTMAIDSITTILHWQDYQQRVKLSALLTQLTLQLNQLQQQLKTVP